MDVDWRQVFYGGSNCYKLQFDILCGYVSFKRTFSNNTSIEKVKTTGTPKKMGTVA
jgi:hypothetical protein